MSKYTKPDSKRFVDKTGFKYGMLTVIGYAGRKGLKQVWHCVCDCGSECVVRLDHLNSGATKSCGCLNIKSLQGRKIHGEASTDAMTPEYRSWRAAKKRCTNQNELAYKNYGGRGVLFLLGTFEMFLSRMGRKPSDKHSLDRIDVNGHYEYGNIRWATKQQQANNQRANRNIAIDGVTRTLAEWCGGSRTALYARCTSKIHKRGVCYAGDVVRNELAKIEVYP